jgi:hypothetical protein
VSFCTNPGAAGPDEQLSRGHSVEPVCRLTTRELFQCNRCKRQVRLTAGTVFQDSKLPLTTWFAAIYT